MTRVEVSKDDGWGGGKDIFLKHGDKQTRIEFEGKNPDKTISSLAHSLERTRAEADRKRLSS